jgi:hypothetical protein
MSDRRAVSAGHLGASSVAAQDAWRVAVGGNRVESMTVEQIAHAFHNGQLNVRTPLWPPGSTGWQALGNFPEFQMHPSAYADQGLSQFVEADDDPTRMWTGGNDLPSMEAAMQAPYGGRPAAQTGVRQVAPRASAQQQQPAYAMQAPPVPSRPAQMHSQPMHSQPMHSQQMHSQPMHSQQMHSQPMAPPPVPSRPMSSRPAPTASVASHQPALVPSNSPFRSKSRGNGLLLVAGLVGLVGLGSAVLAARGNWGSSSERANEVAVSAEAPSTPASAAAADRAAAEAEAPKGEAQLAKYEDTSAFVAGGAAKPAAREMAASGSAASDSAATDTAATDSAKPEVGKLDEPKADAPSADAPSSKQATAKPADDAEEDDAPKAKSEKSSSKSARARSEESSSKRVSAREKKRSAMLERRSKPMARVEKVVEKVEAPEKAEPKPEKVEKPEKAEKAVAAESQQAPASSAVNEAAAAALANSANLASSCRPRGGPAGSGKARVIYSNDGEVQSVEILTAKFRDTVTGSCVRMVFRRAKIPPFKGEPPTFIKSFTVPEE